MYVWYKQDPTGGKDFSLNLLLGNDLYKRWSKCRVIQFTWIGSNINWNWYNCWKKRQCWTISSTIRQGNNWSLFNRNLNSYTSAQRWMTQCRILTLKCKIKLKKAIATKQSNKYSYFVWLKALHSLKFVVI